MKKFIFLLTLILGFSCSNTQETVQELNSDELVSDLISISNSYQSAYISQDWEKASEWVSSDLGTTIYNSNGSALVFQDEQQVANTARGWDFDKFEMSNHKVSMSSNMETAVITFDADGSLSFEDGEQNIPYSTRASQTWVNESGNWKVMHSHWSPRVNSKGIPQQD